jgi:hypothetical protein
MPIQRSKTGEQGADYREMTLSYRWLTLRNNQGAIPLLARNE